MAISLAILASFASTNLIYNQWDVLNNMIKASAKIWYRRYYVFLVSVVGQLNYPLAKTIVGTIQ